MLEISVPETKPATEWINGRALQKMTPRERHAHAQLRFAGALLEWADSRASRRVGTEWDFRVAPPGEPSRPLVPDVAYIAYERRDVEEKVRVYLAAGTEVVFLVRPLVKSVDARDSHSTTTFIESDIIRHPALPDFEIQASRLFFTPKPNV